MITRMLTGIRNRRSDLTYCNVTYTYCFYELTSSTQPICITFYVYNELKLLLHFFKLGIFVTSQCCLFACNRRMIDMKEG